VLLRAPEKDDARAVAALLAWREMAAFGRSEGTLEALREEWGSAEFDLARDALVAQSEEGDVIGYAVAHRFGSFAAVDGPAGLDGLRSRLLDWCERRQHELGWEEHRSSIPADDLAGKALLAGRGYALVRCNWRMRLDLDRFEDLPASAGVTLRRVAPAADGALLHALDQAAFASVPGSEPLPLAAFVEEHLQPEDLDPSLSLLAELDGEGVGFVLTRRRPAESAAYVDILAVHPREQGRGIGRTLLAEAFAAARTAGLAEAQLGVSSDNPTALRLYEGLGMSVSAQLDSYARPIG
jgi:ribosomal protein S18 acetylase RimI-like enzyme